MGTYSCFKYNVMTWIAVLAILSVLGRSKVECQDSDSVNSQNLQVDLPPKVNRFL